MIGYGVTGHGKGQGWMADGQENDPSSEEAEGGQGEPSMEEILSSIRRIISEDDEAEGAKAAPEEGDAGVPEDTEDTDGTKEDEDDVLELTRMILDDGNVTDLTKEKEPEAEMATEMDETDATSEETKTEAPTDENALEMQDSKPDAEAETEQATPTKVKAPPPVSEPDGDSLLDDTTAAAATESFSELTKAGIKEEGPGIRLGSDGDKTLEAVVKEMLRPMLKEWLDQNLPSITEKLVRKEIERAARRAEEL